MKLLRECAGILLLATIPALLSFWAHSRDPELAWSRPSVPEVDLHDVMGWTSPVLWVDARTADAYRKQRLPGAILLNEDSWEKLLPGFLDAWRPGSRVIVYCDSQACESSQGVALRIQRELNVQDIYVLKGGWNSWLEVSH